MLDELECPSLEACKEWSSLYFSALQDYGTVHVDKDKYLTPALNLRRTRTHSTLDVLLIVMP